MLLFLPTTSRADLLLRFQPTLSITTEYTDNLFLSEDNKESEAVAVLTAGFSTQLADRTRGVELQYELGRSLYDRFSEFDSWRHNADIWSWWMLSPHSTLTFGNKFLYTEDPASREGDREYLSDLEEIESETVRRSRQRYYDNRTDIEFLHAFGPLNVVSVKYLFQTVENEDRFVEDRARHRPSFSVVYWPLPGRLSTEADFFFQRYDVSDTPEEDGYWEEEVNPEFGLTYHLIPNRLTLSPRLSYTKGVSYPNHGVSDPEDRYDNWYEIVEPSIEVSRPARPDQLGLEMEILYRKGISYTGDGYSDPSDDYESWDGRFEISTFLGKRTRAFLQYEHTVMDFRGTGEDRSDYTLYNPSVGIEYAVTEDLPLLLEVGLILRDLKTADDDAAVTVNGGLGPWRFNRYGLLNLTASSGYLEDTYGGERLGFGFQYDLRADIEYRFTQYVHGDVYGAYQRNRFTDNETRRREDDDTFRDDRILEGGGGLSIRTHLDWLTLRVGYLYRDVESTDEEDSYRESRVRVDVVSTMPTRFLPAPQSRLRRNQ